MAQIPLGNFGQTNVQPEVAQNRVIATDPNTQNRANQQVAGALQNIGLNILDQRNREEQALSRVKADNALIDRESQIKTIANDLDEQMRTGKLSYDKAPEAYNAAVSKLDPLDTPGLDQAQQGSMNNVLKRMQIRGLEGVQQSADKGRILSAQSDLLSRMDMLGKDAAMPGANVEQINSRMDAEDVDVAGRLAFGETWAHKKQEFKDGNYATSVTQRVNSARDNMQDLNKLEHELTAEDGFYARKLDPNRTTVALNSIMNFKTRIENRAMAAEAKREAGAQRAINAGYQQLSSGIPAPTGFWDEIGGKVKGTSAEGDFKEMVHGENEIQSVLRLPPNEQVSFIQKRQQDLQSSGGTIRDAANLNRLTSAVGNNIKQMQEQPLVWAGNRLGDEPQPLDLSGAIASGGDTSAITSQLKDRVTTLTGMRSLYGDQVKMAPLLPQEASMLSAALEKMGPDNQLQLLDVLHKALPDSESYLGALQQIRPDSPVTAIAGAMYGKKKELTTETHWFKPNDVVTSGDASKTILIGESILNKTKSAKTMDGKGASFPYPGTSDFDAGISSYVGEAYAGRPQSAIMDQQAIKAAYVGRAAQLGDVSGAINPDIMAWAVKATVGEIGEVGGIKTFAPWGMTSDDFEDAAKAQLQKAVLDNRLGSPAIASSLSIKPIGQGQYLVYRGNRKQPSSDGGDLIISIGGDK